MWNDDLVQSGSRFDSSVSPARAQTTEGPLKAAGWRPRARRASSPVQTPRLGAGPHGPRLPPGLCPRLPLQLTSAWPAPPVSGGCAALHISAPGPGPPEGRARSRRCERRSALLQVCRLQQRPGSSSSPCVPSATRPGSEGLSCCPPPSGGPSVHRSSQRIRSPGLWALAFSQRCCFQAPQVRTVEEAAVCRCLQQVDRWWLPQPLTALCSEPRGPWPLPPQPSRERATAQPKVPPGSQRFPGFPRWGPGACFLPFSLGLLPSLLHLRPRAPGPHVGLPAASAPSQRVEVHPIAWSLVF